MYKNSKRFHLYREHPILNKIKKEFSLINKDEELIELFHSSVAFIYPKTIAFSIKGFPPSTTCLELEQCDTKCDTTCKDFTVDETKNIEKVFNPKFDIFMDYLIKSVELLKIPLIFLIDLRGVNILDETFLKKLLLGLNKAGIKVLIIASVDIKKELESDICDSSCELFFSLGDLKKHYYEMLTIESNRYSMKFSKKITLSSIEDVFRSLELKEELLNKILVELDFRNASNISFFALNILNILMNSLSSQYGLLWKILCDKNNVADRLSQLRCFDINKILLYDDEYCESSQEKNSKLFGICTFDKSKQSELINLIDKYILNVARPLSFNYLDNFASVLYNDSDSSYKPQKFRLPYHSFIRNVIYELVDNVTLHSSSTGFFAAYINNGVIYIFIGDYGIGLREGILKNYKLPAGLESDCETIKLLFNLYLYREYRNDKHSFELGAGFGLRDTLLSIFTCKGKVVFRTGQCIGSFMNPVSKSSSPSKVLESSINITGTQYMMAIPIVNSISNIPSTTEDFLKMED